MVKDTLTLILRRLLSRNVPSIIKNSIYSASDNSMITDLINQLLIHSVKNVPYYKNLFNEFHPLERSFVDLPVLTKAIIKDEFHQLKSNDLEFREWFLNSSGGSTGIPITIVQDKEYLDWCAASEDFFYSAFMKIPNYHTVSKIVLWGSERDLFGQVSLKARLSNYLSKRYFFNAFKLTPNALNEFVIMINKKRPVFIKGYSGSLYQVAKYIRETGSVVYAPKAIYSAAETLLPFMRECIEEVFNCRVYDFYGSREVGPIAGQCSLGKMHIFSFNNYVEIVDDNYLPVKPGAQGRVLVTTLHNLAMPLIRYDIGDTAIVGQNCDCGCNLPVLEKITGRLTDHFITEDGTLINGEYFTHLFYFRVWLIEFQVIQELRNVISIYYISKGHAPAFEIQEIEDKIRIVMGHNCQIFWNLTDTIPRSPQGKHLFTKSLVAH